MAQTSAKLIHADDLGLEKASRLVLAGGVIAYPTDTVYGLGCNPFDSKAVERLVRIKQRSKSALPILLNSMTVARRFAEFNRTSLTLAGKFWPGPLTLVVPSREKLPTLVSEGSPFVGLRIPKHEIALELIGLCDGRIIGTSANISGHPPANTANEVMMELGELVDAILDGGPSPAGSESTVAKVLGSGVEILREGAIPRNDILKALRTG
jgi:L-threonylcarbamoyladenylate synthase